MIEVIDVSKRYGKHLAVDRVSFKVDKGEVLGFLGPNGAGKTTVMNIIAGYIPMTGAELLSMALMLWKTATKSGAR